MSNKGKVTVRLEYVDNIMLWKDDAKELEEKLNRLKNIGNKFDIIINL